MSGTHFRVFVVDSRNRHSYARIRDSAAIISVPVRLRGEEREETVKYLRLRLERLLHKHPNRFIGRRIEFRGECVSRPLGILTSIIKDKEPSRKPNYSIADREGSKEVMISLPTSLNIQEYTEAFNAIATRAVIESSIERLSDTIRLIDAEHFRERIGRISIRRSKSVWGSISNNRDLTLNFSLLYVPKEMLEYVIVHELSHIRNRGHDRRFWESVGKVIPDYKERRAWLREHSSLMG